MTKPTVRGPTVLPPDQRAELRRQVAECLGWRVETVQVGGVHKRPALSITPPRRLDVFGPGTASPWLVRDYIDWLEWAQVPDYPNDLDAAIRDLCAYAPHLFRAKHFRLYQTFFGTGMFAGWWAEFSFEWTYGPNNSDEAVAVVDIEETPAVAVCKAFVEGCRAWIEKFGALEGQDDLAPPALAAQEAEYA